MQNFDDKAAILVGCATGIGAQIAKDLTAGGGRVVIADVDAAAAEELATSLSSGAGTAEFTTCDVTSAESIEAACDFTRTRLGGIDLMVNAAAEMRDRFHGNDSNVVDLDPAIWERIISVDLSGFMLTMKNVIPAMLPGGGSIVNISSAAAFLGSAYQPAYAASKAGINALTRHVASRWGKEGIRCNAVAPGLVDTNSARRSVAGTSARESLSEFDDRGANYPLGRLGTVRDIASAATFLLSDEAAWITGQVLSVDGGLTMR